jgi:hypothetical protein
MGIDIFLVGIKIWQVNDPLSTRLLRHFVEGVWRILQCRAPLNYNLIPLQRKQIEKVIERLKLRSHILRSVVSIRTSRAGVAYAEPTHHVDSATTTASPQGISQPYCNFTELHLKCVNTRLACDEMMPMLGTQV